MNPERMLTIREASDMCGVSKTTVDRWRRNDVVAGFVRADPADETSPWLVPMAALFAAGKTGEQRPSKPAAEAPAGADSYEVMATKLEAAEKRAETAEASLKRAEGREATLLDLLSRLELTPPATDAPVEQKKPEPAAAAPSSSTSSQPSRWKRWLGAT